MRISTVSRHNALFLSIPTICSLAFMGAGCGGSSKQEKVEVGTVVKLPEKDVVPAKPSLQLPSEIQHLIDIVPEDAAIVIHVDPATFAERTNTRKLASSFSDLVAPRIAEMTKLPNSFVRDFMAHVNAAVLFVMNDGPNAKPQMPVCFGFAVQDDKQFDALLERLSGHRNADGTWEATRGEESAEGAWIASSRTILGCETQALLKSALAVGLKKAPSFASSKRFQADGPGGTWFSIDLLRFSPDSQNSFEDGSYLFGSIPQKDFANLNLRFVGRGQRFPQLAESIVASSHSDLAKFPAGATALLALSIERAPGKSAAGIVNELARTGAIQQAEVLDGALNELGSSIQEFDSLLGPEVTLGLYADPKFTTKPEEPFAHKGVLVAARTTNDAASKKLWRGFLGKFKDNKNNPRFTLKDDSVTVERHDGNFVRIERRNGHILLAVGEKAFLGELIGNFDNPKASFASNAEFEARRKALKPSHAIAFVDVSEMGRMVGDSPGIELLNLIVEKPDFLTLTLAPTPGSLDISVQSPLSTAGFLGGLGIFATNRYLKSAKIVEAKNSVGRISRGAQEAYERETMSGGHILCKSAQPVPAFVPKGTKYHPNGQAGHDFLTGDQMTGWRCLRFEIDDSIRYQYDYRAGGNYKGPARGGPDPGPQGFEVSAEGDLDGDGKTSLFTLTGSMQNGMLVRATQIFVSDEFE